MTKANSASGTTVDSMNAFEQVAIRRLRRLLDLGEAVLARLDNTEPLSQILLQARRLAQEANDTAAVVWLTHEIEGALPGAGKASEAGKQAVLRWMRYRSIVDPDSVTLGSRPSTPPDRKKVIFTSIDEMERSLASSEAHLAERNAEAKAYPSRLLGPSDPTATNLLRMSVLNDERRRVLQVVRANVYQYVTEVVQRGHEEEDAIAAVGPDYRLVVDNLSALNTELGDELRAALRAISTTNPAEWNGAALICRNIVMKLGRTLWDISANSYFSEMLNKTLSLGGERELNQFTAYLDAHYCKSSHLDEREAFKALAAQALDVYEHGSAGKNAVSRPEARRLVICTFGIVSKLNELTQLRVLRELPDATSGP